MLYRHDRYYAMAACVCDPGYFGVNGTCVKCPSTCSCSGTLISGAVSGVSGSGFRVSSLSHPSASPVCVFSSHALAHTLVHVSGCYPSVRSEAALDSPSRSPLSGPPVVSISVLPCPDVSQRQIGSCNPKGLDRFECASGTQSLLCASCIPGWFHDGRWQNTP